MSDKIAHELWAAAQLLPGEGIEDGVKRIQAILDEINERTNKQEDTWTMQSYPHA